MSQYYYLNDKREPQGPHTLDELATMMARGNVTPVTLIARVGGKSWEPLGTVLSREGSGSEGATPPQLPESIGTCPSCGTLLRPTEEGGAPPFCPQCGRCFLPKKPGIWSNFCLALSHYAKFSGRATRAEFWSFMLITNALYLALFAGMLAGMAGMMKFLYNIFKSIGLEKLQALSELPEAEMDTQLESLIEQHMEGFDMSALEPSGLGLALIILCGLGLLVSVLAFLIPSWSAIVRRLHDRGWSGWWFFTYIIVCFISSALSGAANNADLPTALVSFSMVFSFAETAFWIFLVILNLQDSQRGPNKYGPSTKYPQG